MVHQVFIKTGSHMQAFACTKRRLSATMAAEPSTLCMVRHFIDNTSSAISYGLGGSCSRRNDFRRSIFVRFNWVRTRRALSVHRNSHGGGLEHSNPRPYVQRQNTTREGMIGTHGCRVFRVADSEPSLLLSFLFSILHDSLALRLRQGMSSLCPFSPCMLIYLPFSCFVLGFCFLPRAGCWAVPPSFRYCHLFRWIRFLLSYHHYFTILRYVL